MESIDQYRALIRHSTDIITVLDEAGVVRYQSPSFERRLGYDQEAFVGERVFDYVHPDDRDRVVENFRSFVESPAPVTDRVEYRFRHGDGSWVWLESSRRSEASPAIDGFVVNSREIGDRKRREAELAHRQSLFEALLETSLEGILVVDEDRDYVTWNRQFIDMWGVPEELIGDEPEALGLEWALDRLEDPDEFIEKVEYLYEHPDEESRDEIRLVDGRVFDRYSAPVEGADGTSYGRVWFFRDVTDSKRTEERLQARTEELEALNQLVRHDIRNDVNVVLGWARMLEDHVDAEGRTYLEKILVSGEHITELTEIAREYVDLLTREEGVSVRPMPLRSTLRAEMDLRRESHPTAEVVLEGEIPDVEVRANEMLGSVFGNLLTNAVEHNDAERPVVEVSCSADGDSVVVRVADNGPGIPEGRRDAVFGKGEHGMDSPGTGLGLYLVRTLVEQYGGDVWIEGNEPRGTVVAVELRRVD